MSSPGKMLQDALKQSLEPKSLLLEGLIEDALTVLHHDGDGEGEIDEFERAALRRLFKLRLARVGSSGERGK